MNVAPSPFLDAYLEVLRRAIIYARLMAYRHAPHEQIADLMDALHVVPELLKDWGRCDEPRLRRSLAAYDAKWGNGQGELSFSLIAIFNQALAVADDPG